MKIRLYNAPKTVAILLAVISMVTCCAVNLQSGWFRYLGMVAAIFYGTLFLLTLWGCYRVWVIERVYYWTVAERILVIAPHQDDCVICMGGIGLANRKLGGEVYIVYLTQDENIGLPAIRMAESVAAWELAGVPASNLIHLDILPLLSEKSPSKIDQACSKLQDIITMVRPTMLVIPLFEGGHIHHDIANYMITNRIELEPDVKIIECPEYSPYFSFKYTPHRLISLCARWVFGVVSYYGPPDGIDGRRINILAMTAEEISIKQRMLSAFASQHGDSLAKTRSYPDRFIELTHCRYKSRPFNTESMTFRAIAILHRLLSIKFATAIFPGQIGTYGREPQVTNLDDELSNRTD